VALSGFLCQRSGGVMMGGISPSQPHHERVAGAGLCLHSTMAILMAWVKCRRPLLSASVAGGC